MAQPDDKLFELLASRHLIATGALDDLKTTPLRVVRFHQLAERLTDDLVFLERERAADRPDRHRFGRSEQKRLDGRSELLGRGNLRSWIGGDYRRDGLGERVLGHEVGLDRFGRGRSRGRFQRLRSVLQFGTGSFPQVRRVFGLGRRLCGFLVRRSGHKYIFSKRYG